MAHWAEVDDNDLVITVVVTDNNDPAGDEGLSWLETNLGGRWVKTSYNGNIRKHFAGIGMNYDEALDAFIPPKPFESWILDKETATWQPPIQMPSDGKNYTWNENSQNWLEITGE